MYYKQFPARGKTRAELSRTCARVRWLACPAAYQEQESSKVDMIRSLVSANAVARYSRRAYILSQRTVHIRVATRIHIPVQNTVPYTIRAYESCREFLYKLVINQQMLGVSRHVCLPRDKVESGIVMGDYWVYGMVTAFPVFRMCGYWVYGTMTAFPVSTIVRGDWLFWCPVHTW